MRGTRPLRGSRVRRSSPRRVFFFDATRSQINLSQNFSYLTDYFRLTSSSRLAAHQGVIAEHTDMSAAPPSQVLEARLISPAEIKQHNRKGKGTFWAVVDGFVVDATEFLESHPGGLPKLRSANAAGVGATGEPFGFSFTRGRNSHFPDTGRRFQDGVARFLSGGSVTGSAGSVTGSAGAGELHLPPVDVQFPSHGKIVIIGRLQA